MIRKRTDKKNLTFFLVAFYFTAILWGSVCVSIEASSQPHHKNHHHQKAAGMGHSILCQLACAGNSASPSSAQSLFSALILWGILLSIPLSNHILKPYRFTRNNRAPPFAIQES